MNQYCSRCLADISKEPHPLPRRQAQIFKYLERYIADNGFAPSFEEIASQFKYNSLATVHEHLTSLERKNVITRSYNEARSIRLLVRSDNLGAVSPSSLSGET